MGPIFDEQVCYTLYSTSNIVTQAYKSLLSPLNLTYPQFVVMMALWQKDQVSVTKLAMTIGLSKATMTPLLKRLESLGYVSRKFVEGDERQKNIALTKTGRSLVTQGDVVAKQALCATGLSDAEAKQLISLCQKVKVNLS
ncbi:MarR family transcriptional regulator [Methylophaga sp. 42_25_T18]|nr:MarR family transcriptional regulator [Methylophaga sp. 42_25_T18]OUR88927.1 MarR family transcriptional regulator [Methylophaga sp. 42_8_T64]